MAEVFEIQIWGPVSEYGLWNVIVDSRRLIVAIKSEWFLMRAQRCNEATVGTKGYSCLDFPFVKAWALCVLPHPSEITRVEIHRSAGET